MATERIEMARLAVPHANTSVRPMWARIAVDPVIVRLGQRLASVRGVTPNRVTAGAALLAGGTTACFATGHLRAGGLLFLARYAVDCLDGQVARFQKTSSARGAAFDIAVDVAGVSLCFASLSWYLTVAGVLPSSFGTALLACVIFYNWVLAYRKHLANVAGCGDGGAGGRIRTSFPVLRDWVGMCERLNMSAVPWAVEVEILTLGLAPLFFPAVWMPYVIAAAVGFYLIADSVNLRRVFLLAHVLDDKISPRV